MTTPGANRASRTGPIRPSAVAEDFDLDLIESRTLDGRIKELVCRPTRHG